MALLAARSSAWVIFESEKVRVCVRWHGAHAAAGRSAPARLAGTASNPIRTQASFRTVPASRPGGSFDIDSLLLFGLGFRVQLEHDRPFAISILFALQPVVHGGKSHVRFGKSR